MTHAIRPVDFDNLKTMTYEVTDRVARITFNRPEKGNAIVTDTPLELSALVERADLDPGVHVIGVSGRGVGFYRNRGSMLADCWSWRGKGVDSRNSNPRGCAERTRRTQPGTVTSPSVTTAAELPGFS